MIETLTPTRHSWAAFAYPSRFGYRVDLMRPDTRNPGNTQGVLFCYRERLTLTAACQAALAFVNAPSTRLTAQERSDAFQAIRRLAMQKREAQS